MQHLAPPLDGRPDRGRPRSRGGETVLIVGDELAASAAATLEALGYNVVRAAHAAAALAALDRGTAADLLFARAVDGDIATRQLVASARHARPGLAVLLAGTPPPHADAAGASGLEFVERADDPDGLALRVRHVLGNQQQVNALARALRQSRAATAAPAAPAKPDARWRVLLVEDQDEVRDTSRQLLELLGCEVRAVSDAESAEAALQHAPFDVMLTDVALPGRNGLELARAAAARQPALRIVVCSGYGSTASRVPGVRTWTLPKPYGLRELETLLGEFART